MKHFKHKFEQALIEWCINRGITRKTSPREFLIALAMDHEQCISFAEAKQAVVNVLKSRTSSYDEICLLKNKVEKFISKFYGR